MEKKLNKYAAEAEERKESGRKDTRDESEVDKEINESKLKATNENSCKSQDHTETTRDEDKYPASTPKEGEGKHAGDESGHGGG